MCVCQDNGDLVLLDFGQCKALPVERHLSLARLVVAMDDGDPVVSGLGGRMPHANGCLLAHAMPIIRCHVHVDLMSPTLTLRFGYE